MGDGAVSSTRSGHGARFRFGHGETPDGVRGLEGLALRQRRDRVATFETTVSFSTISNRFPSWPPSVRHVYAGKKKVFGDDYLKCLTPLSLALWYMDDAQPHHPVQGLADIGQPDSPGRATICIEAMEPATRERLVAYLADTWGIRAKLVASGATEKAVLVFNNAETAKLHALIAPFVHPEHGVQAAPGVSRSVLR